MRREWKMGMLCLALGLASASWAQPKPTKTPAVREISMDAIMDLKQVPKENLGVAGVVSRVFPDKKAFYLIEAGEFERCGTSCPPFQLPVFWAGKMPMVRSFVRITGHIRMENHHMVFDAREVKKESAPKARPKEDKDDDD